MNEAAMITNALLLVFILWLIYGPWQRLVNAYIRQRIFEVREKLLYAGANGKINFYSKEYQLIEERLNSFIRYTHKVTWQRSLFTFILAKRKPELMTLKPEFDINYLISKVKDTETRSMLRIETNKMFLFYLLGIFIKSPVLIIVTFLGAIVFLAAKLIRVVSNKQIEFVEEAGNKLGNIIEKDMQLCPIKN